MRIEKAQGTPNQVDIIHEREDVKRYSLADIQKRIDDLNASIARFTSQRDNWQNIYDQARQKIGE